MPACDVIKRQSKHEWYLKQYPMPLRFTQKLFLELTFIYFWTLETG